MAFGVQTLGIGFAQTHRRAADFIELTKPRVVLMILVTTLVGFYLGTRGAFDYALLMHTLFGTALSAAGTLALNQFLERETDGLMERTRRRPLPTGDRKSTRLNSSHIQKSRMPSSA